MSNLTQNSDIKYVQGDYIEPMINKPGPPVYYPTEEMYSTKHVIAHGEYSKVSIICVLKKDIFIYLFIDEYDI